MWVFHMSVVFMLRRRRVVFDMRVVFVMFMRERLKSDVPVGAYAKGKLAGGVAGHKYVNEKDNEYFGGYRSFQSHGNVIKIPGSKL